jgi:uncharacterized protein YggE
MKFKNAATALAAAILACSCMPAFADDGGAAADCSAIKSRITITGRGVVEAEPDEAVLSFTTRQSDKSPAVARSKCERVMTAFLKSLEGIDVKKDAVNAGSISLYPKMSYDEKHRKQVTDGYEAARTVQVRLSDFSKIAEVTDLAMSSGFNEAGGFSYRIKDDAKYRYEADEKAIADARAQAEHLASGFGLKLLKPCELSFERNGARPVFNGQLRLMAAKADNAAAPESRYTPGSQTVNSTVHAVFAAQ